MSALGRPTSFNRQYIANICLKHYWKHGIQNISYNDIIKLSNISKGSFYKFFKDEDDLLAETVIEYYKDSNDFLNKIDQCEDLFKLLYLLKNWKYKHKISYCYFFSCYMEMYKLGKKTRKVINDFAINYKLLVDKIIRNHFKKNKASVENLNVKELVNYYFNNFVIINLLRRNKVKDNEVTLYSNNLIRYTFNLIKN